MCSQRNSKNAFSEVLKTERARQKLSANQLSILSGVNRKTILDIEKGAVPNLETADKLCRALHIVFMIGKGA